MFATTDFLLPNATFFAEVVAFLVVVGVLAKKALPAINQQLVERQEHIRQGLAAGDEGRRILVDSRQEAERILDEARREGRALVEQAAQVAEQTREDLIAKARQDAERLLERAQGEIERATERANEEVRRSLVELVISTAEHVIGEELDASRHRKLIEDAASSLESSAS